ncbi:hypothetical protein SAMN05216357_11065 [Porphyromonadaceae bacterium KH3CP3RA]|nr:hypothetical protein SAMN05216357_11065 [Porphyromonadaceae bacterium KH3CP3RA]
MVARLSVKIAGLFYKKEHRFIFYSKIVMEKIISQLNNALHTAYGWFLALMTASITFIQPEIWSFYVVGGAILADLIWGIAAAVKLKKFILSKALRETIKKVGVYAFALVGALAIERITHAEGTFIAVRTIALFAAVCEFWSMSASMLIVKPDMPFLKLFRGQLKGEIASKVSKNVNVDEILKD